MSRKKAADYKELEELAQEYAGRLLMELNFRLLCETASVSLPESEILWVESVELLRMEKPEKRTKTILEKIKAVFGKVICILKRKKGL